MVICILQIELQAEPNDDDLAQAMKILHIASGDLWAGAESQLYTLLATLQKGMQATIVVVILNPGKLANKLQDSGITTLVLDERRDNSARIMWQIQQFIKLQRPNLIHTHRVKENILGAILARLNGLPSVRTAHGSSEHAYNPRNPRQRLLHDGNYLAGRFLQRKIIAVSDALGRELANTFPATQIQVIYNGIETLGQQAHTHQRERFQSPLQVGVVGRLAPVKRVDLFLDMAHQCLSQAHQTGAMGDQRLQFHIIGDGPLRSNLESQAGELNITDQITFHGNVDNAENAIAQLDVLVICSDHEGLPMVALEAMKHQTLILTHAIGGLPTLLGEGRYGQFAREHSATAFCIALHRIIDNEVAMVRQARDAQRQLEAHYSATHMAQQYLDLYQTVLAPQNMPLVSD